MFQLISEHGAAGGQVLASLGQIVKDLLGILGQLVGAGVELGSHILPGIASALGQVAHGFWTRSPRSCRRSWLRSWASALSTALAGPIAGLAEKLAGMGSAGGAAASALNRIGGALPVIGVAVGLTVAAFEQSQQKINDWAHALLDGGAAAEQAAHQMVVVSAQSSMLNSGLTGLIAGLTGYGNALNIGAGAGKQAEKQGARPSTTP
jgi:hypothetical protein